MLTCWIEVNSNRTLLLFVRILCPSSLVLFTDSHTDSQIKSLCVLSIQYNITSLSCTSPSTSHSFSPSLSTALFVATATEYFPSASLGLITAVLTAFTLFFGELLPKALAVSNSELVARKVSACV